MDRPLLILDGGMGHLLMEKGVGGGPNKKKLFAGGGLANLNEPKVVISLHESFIEAGADVITTNNFGLTPASLEASGLGESLSQYIEAAGLVAWEAAHTKHGAVLVAGCLPPLTLAYANIDVREAELHQPIYNQIVEALLPNVDLFLCETMATEAQTWAAASAASASGKPFWISWTLADQEGPPVLRGSGEPLEHAIKRMCTFPGLHALLLNCCAPQVISTALQVMRKATPPHIRIGAYPNGFKTSTSEWCEHGCFTRTSQGILFAQIKYKKTISSYTYGYLVPLIDVILTCTPSHTYHESPCIQLAEKRLLGDTGGRTPAYMPSQSPHT